MRADAAAVVGEHSTVDMAVVTEAAAAEEVAEAQVVVRAAVMKEVALAVGKEVAAAEGLVAAVLAATDMVHAQGHREAVGEVRVVETAEAAVMGWKAAVVALGEVVGSGFPTMAIEDWAEPRAAKGAARAEEVADTEKAAVAKVAGLSVVASLAGAAMQVAAAAEVRVEAVMGVEAMVVAEVAVWGMALRGVVTGTGAMVAVVGSARNSYASIRSRQLQGV